MKRRTTKTARSAPQALPQMMALLRSLKAQVAELEAEVKRRAEAERAQADAVLRALGDGPAPTPVRGGRRKTAKDRDVKPEKGAAGPERTKLVAPVQARIAAFLATVPEARIPEIMAAVGGTSEDAVGQAVRLLVAHGHAVRVARGRYRGAGAPGLERAEREPPSKPSKANGQHDAALAWLEANPDDPRAPGVRKKLGLDG